MAGSGALKGDDKYPKINSSYVKDVDKLKSDCDRYFTTGMAGKFPYMLQWMQNINFLAGNQWLYFNPSKKMFEIDPNLEDESRVTINKILPAYRTAVGSLLRDRMTAKIIQQNNDETEIDAAKVKTRLLEHINRVNRFMDTLKESIEWAAICGKGVRKKWWDPDEERIVDEVIQTFEFVTPSNVRKMSKMPWVCHARYETIEWVYENYGIDLSDDNKKEKITRGTSDYGQYGSFLAAVKHIMEDGFFTGLAPTATFNNVMVKEFWFRPNNTFPDGLLAIFLNDELIFADRNPISGKLDPSKKRRDFYLPFNEMDFFDLPFRYWPMSLVESVIGMQQYYNQFMSDGIENFKYAGAPVVVGPAGAVDQDDQIIRPGQYIPYNPAGGGKPEFLNPQPIQPAMFEMMNQLASGIGEQVGIHQFGRGMLPAGLHAAAALAIINEQDQITKMGLTINLENYISTDALQNLYLVQKFWPDKFMIRYMGDENRWEVEEFDQKKYHVGDEEVVIESKQELAQDKMTRFDQVLKLMTTPRVDNPQEPVLDTNTGLRILDLEKEMSTVSLRDLNWNMAKQENESMADGKRVTALQYEDHKLHIEAHMQYMLRVDFKDLPDKIRNLFLDHWQQHMQMLNGSQQNAGAQASQTEQQQPQMQPGMMPGMPGQMPMGQPQAAGAPPNVMPFPNPMQSMPGATGLAGGLQGGMTNAMNQAFGRPGGSG